MRNLNNFMILTTAFIAFGCGGHGRVLTVKSDPADAEVCIKGRARSEHFSNTKSCVGTTPFEADRVDVTDPDGDKRTVKFKDIEADKESFYVVVTHSGYAAQAVEVPAWEHMVVLKSIGAAAAPVAVPAVVPAVPDPAAPAPASTAPGTVSLTTDPTGALVYINDALKGNSPFNHSGAAGPVKIKFELDGYTTVEKTVTLEAGVPIKLNFKLQSNKAAASEAKKAQPAQSEPIKVKEETPPEPKAMATPAPKTDD